MTREFKLRVVNEEGDVEGCDSCGSDVETVEVDTIRYAHPAPPERGTRLLCRFCYETLAGSYTEHPGPDTWSSLRAEIWKASACVYNMLRADMIERDKAGSVPEKGGG